jgi:hypothetical protein
MKRKPLIPILLLGSAVGLWAWVSRPVTVSQLIEKQPAQVQDCLKKQAELPELTAVERVNFIAQATERNQKYYLYRFERNKKEPWQVIVSSPVTSSSSTETCQVEYSRLTRDQAPFSSDVPQSAANELRLEQLQKIAQQQGDKFSKPIKDAIAANFLGKLAPEDIWALQKMGYEIPLKKP